MCEIMNTILHTIKFQSECFQVMYEAWLKYLLASKKQYFLGINFYQIGHFLFSNSKLAILVENTTTVND